MLKMSILVEEGLRQLRNCSRGLDCEVRKRIMESWVRKLRRSGYPASVRHQVISEALTKHDKMCETDDKGGWPIHRDREWQKASMDGEGAKIKLLGTRQVNTRYQPHSSLTLQLEI